MSLSQSDFLSQNFSFVQISDSKIPNSHTQQQKTHCQPSSKTSANFYTSKPLKRNKIHKKSITFFTEVIKKIESTIKRVFIQKVSEYGNKNKSYKMNYEDKNNLDPNLRIDPSLRIRMIKDDKDSYEIVNESQQSMSDDKYGHLNQTIQQISSVQIINQQNKNKQQSSDEQIVEPSYQLIIHELGSASKTKRMSRKLAMIDWGNKTNQKRIPLSNLNRIIGKDLKNLQVTQFRKNINDDQCYNCKYCKMVRQVKQKNFNLLSD